ncbi:hypothetical protein L9F63_014256 [Diploptera punctata]|uniref:Uncharacterized protein n=1 Tax=Diploptera punctata TaxID=6984 RepID=A0AAD8EL95_DIPPU|nr:hypothetical protein L9F63_014256 [Diploptera punctata]
MVSYSKWLLFLSIYALFNLRLSEAANKDEEEPKEKFGEFLVDLFEMPAKFMSNLFGLNKTQKLPNDEEDISQELNLKINNAETQQTFTIELYAVTEKTSLKNEYIKQNDSKNVVQNTSEKIDENNKKTNDDASKIELKKEDSNESEKAETLSEKSEKIETSN